MIETLVLPIAWKYEHFPLPSEDKESWWDTQELAFLSKVEDAKDELNRLLMAGYVVLSSHLWDSDYDTVIFYVLYRAPDKDA